MADSFNKKERQKLKEKRKKEKLARKEQRKKEGKSTEEFLYLDEDGNFTETPPDPTVKRKSNVVLADIDVSIPRKEKSDESDFVKEGIVKFFNQDKGYGFINELETGESFFVHHESCIDDIGDNNRVSFEIGKGPKGPMAVNVKLVK